MSPTKLTTKVLRLFKEVLEEAHNSVVCTDYELCFLLNDRLPEAEQISYRTFQRYKATAMEREKGKDTPLIYKELYRLLMRAIIQQKNALYEQLMTLKTGYQRVQWIMERKFPEWNLRLVGQHSKEAETFEPRYVNVKIV